MAINESVNLMQNHRQTIVEIKAATKYWSEKSSIKTTLTIKACVAIINILSTPQL